MECVSSAYVSQSTKKAEVFKAVNKVFTWLKCQEKVNVNEWSSWGKNEPRRGKKPEPQKRAIPIAYKKQNTKENGLLNKKRRWWQTCCCFSLRKHICLNI